MKTGDIVELRDGSKATIKRITHTKRGDIYTVLVDGATEPIRIRVTGIRWTIARKGD